jgi:hypothetical protein
MATNRTMKASLPLVISGALLFLHGYGHAAEASAPVLPPGLRQGYIVPQETLSPDGRYGITAFDDTVNEIPDQVDDNKLIEVKTGRILASVRSSGSIQRTGYMTYENHGGILPTRWSSDGNLALWEVEGKWGVAAIVLLVLKDAKVTQQLDILTTIQHAILRETQKAAPKAYSKAKIDDAGTGSAYPEGFTVDADVSGPIKFPLQVVAALTSNPKGDEGMTELDSHLEGTINEKGELKVTLFKLGHVTPPHGAW